MNQSPLNLESPLATAGQRRRVVLTVLAAACRVVLLFGDARWSVLSVVVYALCFTVVPSRPRLGIGFAAAVTAGWTVAWAIGDSPGWTVAIPVTVFVGGSALSFMIDQSRQLNVQQGELIAQLQATRAELSESERVKGALEERARLAGEIHDTIAQGFTSIVLLSRAAQRDSGPDDHLASIEDVAQQNLDAARRLVHAQGPAELVGSSLPSAVGFTPGTVSDRGSLTGGQGLRVLGDRARALGGSLIVESEPGDGTVVSVSLPDGAR